MAVGEGQMSQVTWVSVGAVGRGSGARQGPVEAATRPLLQFATKGFGHPGGGPTSHADQP